VSLQQILRGPLKPTIVQMERWAAGDGNASEAFNKHEAIELWEAHARNPQVNIYRRNIMLRRVGIYHHNEEDDDDISQCTEFLTVFTIADAGHTTYDLDPVPIWAAPSDVAEYNHRILVNERLGEGDALLAMTNHLWMTTCRNSVPTFHVCTKTLVFGWNNTILTLILIGSSASVLCKSSSTCGEMQPVWKCISIWDNSNGNMRPKLACFTADGQRTMRSKHCMKHSTIYHLGTTAIMRIDPLPHPGEYLDQLGEFWPPGMAAIIHNQRVMAPRAQGPPDWVSAPEGISYTCEDVTITMRTRLPIPEGCLNSDM
jgi:hypothetical protein